MAELIFYYGTMGSSKTANALITNFQYTQSKMHVWLIKPAVDTRDDNDGNTILKSRIGLEATAQAIAPTENIISTYCIKHPAPEIIICDEAQFLTAVQVDELKLLAEQNNVKVICYGIRTDFLTHLFEGSKRLLEVADRIIKIESICECGRPAEINCRLDETGVPVFEGSQVELGGNDKYKAICWKCYYNAILKYSHRS